ncbi:MAG: DUF998 domain-containing protein [Acidimicrobiia bacterium]|nr:DUF998 domain-containing protein [Acidimicrobiia bacterium]
MSISTKPDATDGQPRTGSSKRPTPASVSIIGLLAAALIAFAVAPTLVAESYSWVEFGISESAAQGVEGAWLARVGMILFGLAVLWLVGLGHRDWGPLATAMHLLFGVSMFGVAAFAAKSWEDGAAFVETEDALHSAFAATAGFGIVVGIAVLIVRRRRRSVRAALPDWVAFLVTALIPLTASTDIWGLMQRIMFFAAAAWYAREAWSTPSTDQAR